MMNEATAPKLIWLLNTEKGLLVLREILAHAKDQVALVSSYTDANVKEDFCASISDLCQANNIPFVSWSELKANLGDSIKEKQASGLVAIGWQYLVPHIYWESLPIGLIIFHDSLLPRYRGFAPVATGIINGDREFGISVLYAGNGIDDGNLIMQRRIQIGSTTYIAEAIHKIGQLYCEAALELCALLKNKLPAGRVQDHEKATYSIWRDLTDCQIDWNKSAHDIFNLVRAVSHPYPGAYSYINGSKVIIWRAELVQNDVCFQIRDPGKVWQIDDGKPLIVCGQGMLRLTRIANEEGLSLLPFKKLRQRFKDE